MFRVLVYFEDLQDNRHAYHVGDTFPREGLDVTEERLHELSTENNRRGVALIEEEKPGDGVTPIEEETPGDKVEAEKPKKRTTTKKK